MASIEHDDHEPGFEAGCPACELDEVSLQDTGRPWGARVIRLPAANPMPQQQDRRTA